MTDKVKMYKDAFSNTTTGIGVSGRDKRVTATVTPNEFSFDELQNLWQGDALAARIVEGHAEELVRAGWDFSSGDDQFDEVVEDAADGLNLQAVIKKALCFQRALGGAVILLGVQDGSKNVTNLQNPLDIKKVKTLDYLSVFSANEASVERVYSNPLSPNYGKAEVYKITPKQVSDAPAFLVHESRLLVFDSQQFGKFRDKSNGWGQPILSRCFDALRDFSIAFQAAAHLLNDFSQTVYKSNGLKEILASENGASIVLNRMASIDIARSVARGVMLDGDEDLQRVATPTTGMPELLDKMAEQLAASAKMPVTLLFGQSPAGLNATGSSELRMYYDAVSSEQNSLIRPQLNKLYTVICKALGASETPKFKIRFNPLWQMSDLEKAQIRAQLAQADAVYLANGVLTPDEIAMSRFGGVEYSIDVSIDLASRGAVSEGVPSEAQSSGVASASEQTTPSAGA